jgi:hypothetical protein
MIYKTIDEWIEHNPNHRGLLPIEVCHQIWGTKDNEKPWVGLTDGEISDMFCVMGTADADINLIKLLTDARRIEAKLKEKNT